MIDTHSHINTILELNTDEILENAKRHGIEKVIVPAACKSDFDDIMKLIDKYENVYGMLGIHPSEAKDWDDSIIDKIREYSKNKKIVGIGEIGLDYYWDKSFNELQKEIFIKQIKLANSLNLPIDIHDREAHKDTFDIVKKYNKNSTIIMHCFSGSVEFAKECIKEGWYLGIGGVVTFKNAIKMKEVAKNIPIENLLLETDAPYLTPQKVRGRANEPSFIPYTVEVLAEARGESSEDIMRSALENAVRVLELPIDLNRI